MRKMRGRSYGSSEFSKLLPSGIDLRQPLEFLDLLRVRLAFLAAFLRDARIEQFTQLLLRHLVFALAIVAIGRSQVTSRHPYGILVLRSRDALPPGGRLDKLAHAELNVGDVVKRERRRFAAPLADTRHFLKGLLRLL